MNNYTNMTNFNDYQNCFLTNTIIRYFGTTIFIIGILSTTLSMAVFSQKPLRKFIYSNWILLAINVYSYSLSGQKSCCFYFLILSISDIVHLFTMVIELMPYSFHIDLITIHDSICKIIIFLIYFSNHLSNIVLTLASM